MIICEGGKAISCFNSYYTSTFRWQQCGDSVPHSYCLQNWNLNLKPGVYLVSPISYHIEPYNIYIIIEALLYVHIQIGSTVIIVHVCIVFFQLHIYIIKHGWLFIALIRSRQLSTRANPKRAVCQSTTSTVNFIE